MTTEQQADRLLRMPQVEAAVGLKKSAIYDRMNPKSEDYDPTFPRKRKVGSASVWSEAEVQDWIRKVKRDGGNTLADGPERR